jgi:hypothetical protein
MTSVPNDPERLRKRSRSTFPRSTAPSPRSGPGQEIANWFFRAGGASGTVAKTMSAYDMIISDEIYGKATRYVSRQRMCAMLEHEYPMLIQRLACEARRDDDLLHPGRHRARPAVSVTPKRNAMAGWACVSKPSPAVPSNDIQLHVRLLDESNARQADALGKLGVNLIYAAFHLRESASSFSAKPAG